MTGENVAGLRIGYYDPEDEEVDSFAFAGFSYLRNLTYAWDLELTVDAFLNDVDYAGQNLGESESASLTVGFRHKRPLGYFVPYTGPVLGFRVNEFDEDGRHKLTCTVCTDPRE